MGSGELDLDVPDEHRRYSEAEQLALNLNLERLVVEIRAGSFNTRSLDLDLLCELHRRLFHGVRDFAGRYRQRDWGDEVLVFGPIRSPHRRDVKQLLDAALRRAEVDRREILDADPHERNMLAAFILAVRAHADVVRIHPFEDGNGRTSRLLMSVILVSFDVEPVSAEFPKDEYNECLNVYHRVGDILPVVDVLLRAHPTAITDA